MNWSPVLNQGDASLYVALADALERDIQSGTLAPGTRLPPHRALAHRLSVGVGTVTKAYEEAERRGLITAQVGRGSFVAALPEAAAGSQNRSIDLSMNVPPLDRAATELAEAFRALGKRARLIDHFSYGSQIGSEADRKAGAQWLAWAGRVTDPDWQRVACTLGAQQAMAMAFAALASPGDVILCEGASYWGMKTLAQHGGYRLKGVAMDGEGICPAALERAVAETGARLLYCMPTLQNPTARVMSVQRRRAITDIARRRGLWIVEDDVYGHYASGLDVEPIVNLAPDRTIYVSSLSKSVLPGLRAGYMLVPDATLLDRIAVGLRATIYSPPGLGALIATEWIESGKAREIANWTYGEIAARNRLALDLLGNVAEAPAGRASLHIWLPMEALDAERVANRALRLGVSLLAPSMPRIDDTAPSGLRLCLGPPSDRATLVLGLERIRSALSEPGQGDEQTII